MFLMYPFLSFCLCQFVFAVFVVLVLPLAWCHVVSVQAGRVGTCCFWCLSCLYFVFVLSFLLLRCLRCRCYFCICFTAVTPPVCKLDGLAHAVFDSCCCCSWHRRLIAPLPTSPLCSCPISCQTTYSDHWFLDFCSEDLQCSGLVVFLIAAAAPAADTGGW